MSRNSLVDLALVTDDSDGGGGRQADNQSIKKYYFSFKLTNGNKKKGYWDFKPATTNKLHVIS